MMKQIFLSITILCASTFAIHADLLNGPWSSESQELVRLVQNPTLSIPKSLDYRKIQINRLRTQFAPDWGNAEFYPSDYLDRVFSETVVQLLLLQKPKPKYPTPYPSNEGYKYVIATIALARKDFDMLNAILKNTSTELKNKLLLDILNFTGRLAWHDTERIKRVEKTYKSQNLIEDGKQKIKALLNSGAQINAKNNDPLEPIKNKPLITDELPVDYTLLTFLIEQGLDINTIFENSYNFPANQTLLDCYIYYMNPASQSYAEAQKFSKDIQKIIDYLKANGAKTYAELVPTKQMLK
jgi:hypothetical protein